MHMLFQPPKNLSSFKVERISQRIQAFLPKIKTLEIIEVLWIASSQNLSPEEIQKLQPLFPHATNHFDLNNKAYWLVTPRQGTLSPWSSKATEILQQCGIQSITRIEKGLLYIPQFIDNHSPNFDDFSQAANQTYDRMTESIWYRLEDAANLFLEQAPKKLEFIPYLEKGRIALEDANQTLGLALAKNELDYLDSLYQNIERNPTDAELMMFGVVNSEHCRHKIFNATWVVDGQQQEKSLFEMIKNTYQHHPQGTLVAYKDNAAVLEGGPGAYWSIDANTKVYGYHEEPIHWVIKVETHNHPTAISPFPGAATGSGGELRDEGATGIGATPKAGLTGFAVSHLNIPQFIQPWEINFGKPATIASAYEIMLSAPIGAASYNNEFGRPNLAGYFRCYTSETNDTHTGEKVARGYHKPIMLAGGLGRIREQHVYKKPLTAGTLVGVLGGPAMRIGLGGGTVSSLNQENSNSDLDFASVQRDNPEMQRRCQEVLHACIALGAANPILSIHDVGAGGLSNAIPEIAESCERGVRVELRTIPTAESELSPMELWCNEAQERYVLAIAEDRLAEFQAVAERENCPFAIVGELTEDPDLIVGDGLFEETPVNMPMSTLFADVPKMRREASHHFPQKQSINFTGFNLKNCIYQVLKHPTVANKRFLITIGDRTVGGLSARDQMVGPWQVPVADCAVTIRDFKSYAGEAMAIGERAPLAILNPAASARMAVAEAITNILSADVNEISEIKLSANWMAACGVPGEDAALFDAVKAIGMELCPALGIAIPVGKDSLSMKVQWQEGQIKKQMVSPMSLIISAFARVQDVRTSLTPQLQADIDSNLILLDLGKGHQRLGGSIFLETQQTVGDITPDLDAPETLKHAFSAITELKKQNKILAYHDRSDGGLLATLCEMMFASHLGISVLLDDLGDCPFSALFNEELGLVIQVKLENTHEVMACLQRYGLGRHTHIIGIPQKAQQLEIFHHGEKILSESRVELEQAWSEVSYHMQKNRDNPECAQEEFDAIKEFDAPFLTGELTFTPAISPIIPKTKRPKVAILREQGVNGHFEMAAAFESAGFETVDIHMRDILENQQTLSDFQGLVACGGFSYGDVLGAGRGWASRILYHPHALTAFSEFFQRKDTFTLGVCNGCQMLSQLKNIIPGANHWPEFIRNRSEQFEARLSLVEILPSPSIFLRDMAGSKLPIVVSHGEGLAKFSSNSANSIVENQLAALRFLDPHHQPTERYPFNPNGSEQGLTAFSSQDGRALIMMPHPERIFRTLQMSWAPKNWQEFSPWQQLFVNAYHFVKGA